MAHKQKAECALRTYLRNVRECPDELVNSGKGSKSISRLAHGFGISNDWPIRVS